MKNVLNSLGEENESEMEITSMGSSSNRPVDVLVATPVKALEMVRGWGWDKTEEINGKKFVPGKPEMGLADVEYVVVDEADVLYGK